MSLLKDNQKKHIRLDNKVFTLYEPYGIQLDELTNMIMENSKLEGDEIVGEYGLKIIRYMLRELTNIGEEVNDYSDEELESLLDNGNAKLKELIRELECLISEICEDMVNETNNKLKMFNGLLNTLNTNDDINKMKEKFNKLSKKHKWGINFEELIVNNEEQIKLNNKLNK